MWLFPGKLMGSPQELQLEPSLASPLPPLIQLRKPNMEGGSSSIASTRELVYRATKIGGHLIAKL